MVLMELEKEMNAKIMQRVTGRFVARIVEKRAGSTAENIVQSNAKGSTAFQDRNCNITFGWALFLPGRLLEREGDMIAR